MTFEHKINQLTVLLCFLMGIFLLATPVLADETGIGVTIVTESGESKDIQLYSGYHALVIGCSAYTSGWPKLKDRVADAQGVATTLKNLGWMVDFIENPDGQTLKREFQKLVFNQGKDREKGILIWFSGHGYTLQEADGTGLGYLVPVDAPDPGIDPIGFSEKALSLRDLETVARQIMSKHVLMVFDASLAGDTFLMGLPKPDAQMNEKMTAPVRQIIIGGQAGAVAPEKAILDQLFIQSVLKGFADFNSDGYVTGQELGLFLSKKLANTDQERANIYGKINNPKLNSGDFVFVVPESGSEKSGKKDLGAKKQAVPRLKKTIVNSLDMIFNYIPPGKFLMGSPKTEPGRDEDEDRHPVTLTKGFYMQTTEVTQKQWKALMGNNPSKFPQCGDDCPVESINWLEAQEFVKRLNQQDGYGRYRLPTEAEWEYASRAGSDKATYAGNMPILGERNAPALNPIAWYGGNSCVDYPEGRNCSQWKQKQYSCAACGIHEVGLKEPNAWGLYDMLGNVYEWCQDYFAKYPTSAVTDPTGPVRGTRRVTRGGAWDYHAKSCRSANRNHFFPRYQSYYVGLRLVMDDIK
jgi:formylglycine-generating enzyme required for sulfatase activity